MAAASPSSKPIDILIGCGVHRVTFPAPQPCYAHRSGVRLDGNYELAAVHILSKGTSRTRFRPRPNHLGLGLLFPRLNPPSEAKHAAICRLVRLRVPLPARLGTALVDHPTFRAACLIHLPRRTTTRRHDDTTTRRHDDTTIRRYEPTTRRPPALWCWS
ncbi:hypothetical protein E4U43_005555 [Claviceps pusilla]|uniref:Uncharacterized protein n=1 Tax=Claviceps pusilla TaxID=123648 RepID=A0A9P7N1X3_9HYPO|nr:hypothetical protein E4U43_005555 [Claviceps pusilla]